MKPFISVGKRKLPVVIETLRYGILWPMSSFWIVMHTSHIENYYGPFRNEMTTYIVVYVTNSAKVPFQHWIESNKLLPLYVKYREG